MEVTAGERPTSENYIQLQSSARIMSNCLNTDLTYQVEILTGDDDVESTPKLQRRGGATISSLMLMAATAVIIISLVGCGPTLRLNEITKINRELEDARSRAYMAAKRLDKLLVDEPMSSFREGEAKEEVDETVRELDDLFMRMMVECHGILSRFEDRARAFQWAELGIAITGALAGSIVAPTLIASAAEANKVWSAAFSGLSGAANTSQAAMRQLGLSSREALVTRAKIRDEWKSAMDDFWKIDDATSISDRSNALQKAMTSCVNYALTIPEATIAK